MPPNPKAGGRTTNGYVWAENIANDYHATIMDYAIGGAVTDKKLWPSKANNSDFIGQLDLFLSQNHRLDPRTTLYAVFFGINDYSAAKGIQLFGTVEYHFTKLSSSRRNRQNGKRLSGSP